MRKYGFLYSAQQIKAFPLALFLLFVIRGQLLSQDKTQYLIQELPQTISLNPAIQYTCKNYIMLPGISGLSAFIRNNGFSYNQVFEGGRGVSADSLRIDYDRLSDVMWKNNKLHIGGSISLFGLGFESRGLFFSAEISNHSDFRLVYEKSILDARDGNWDLSTDSPRDIHISGSGAHLLNYTSFAVGLGGSPARGLQIGARLKYLSGAAHLQTKKSDLSLITSPAPVELRGVSDFLVRSSLPVDLQLNQNGYIESVESNVNSLQDLASLIFSGNHGIGVDLGLIYEINPDMVFSASILDLGFIRWRNNTQELAQNEEFVFQGIDLSDYTRNSGSTDLLEALEDSVINNFRIQDSDRNYSAMLPLRMIAGMEYRMREKFSLGAVFEGEVFGNRFYPSLSLSAISRPYDWLSASLSYSLMDRWLANFGMSLVVGKGPLQFYVVSDNIPFSFVKETETGMIWPYRARTFNLRAGINVIIGCKDERIRQYKMQKWRKSCPAYH